MCPTLEDFFKGKPHNCLSNRVFVRIDGMLMEQRATDLSQVSSPTFHDIVTGKAPRDAFKQRGVPIRINDQEIGRGDVSEVNGNLQLRVPDDVMRTISDFAGAEEETQFSIRSLQPSLIGTMGSLKRQGAFIEPYDESMTNQNFMANSVAERRVTKRFATARAELTLGNFVDARHKFRTGNLEIEAGVLEGWILRSHPDSGVEDARAQEIARLIKGDLQAGPFVCKLLRFLAEPITQGDSSDYDFSPAFLRQINHLQLCDLFKQARPVALAITGISEAFKAVQAAHPEVKYVYFDEQLRWKHVDRNFTGIEVGDQVSEDLLETAALTAVDRGLLGKWLNPAA